MSNQSAFSKAVHKVAEHMREHSHLFVQDGPSSMTTAECAARQAEIKLCADRMDAAASKTYAEFEAVLDDAKKLDFLPDNDDVGRVADASMSLPK